MGVDALLAIAIISGAALGGLVRAFLGPVWFGILILVMAVAALVFFAMSSQASGYDGLGYFIYGGIFLIAGAAALLAGGMVWAARRNKTP